MSSFAPFTPSTPSDQSPTPHQSWEESQALAKRSRRLQMIPVFLLLLVGLVVLALSLAPEEDKADISELSLFLSMLFCFCCTTWAMLRTPRGRARWAWSLLAGGQLLYVLGDLGDVILTAQRASASSLSFPDLFQLPLLRGALPSKTRFWPSRRA